MGEGGVFLTPRTRIVRTAIEEVLIPSDVPILPTIPHILGIESSVTQVPVYHGLLLCAHP